MKIDVVQHSHRMIKHPNALSNIGGVVRTIISIGQTWWNDPCLWTSVQLQLVLLLPSCEPKAGLDPIRSMLENFSPLCLVFSTLNHSQCNCQQMMSQIHLNCGHTFVQASTTQQYYLHRFASTCYHSPILPFPYSHSRKKLCSIKQPTRKQCRVKPCELPHLD